jgi:hypothetical protein
MYRYLVLITILSFLYSCQQTSSKAVAGTDSLQQQSVVDSTLDTPARSADPTKIEHNKSPIEGKTFILGSYRIADDDTTGLEFKEDWLDLRNVKGAFQLSAPDYTIEKGFDECAGMKSETIVSNHSSLLYLKLPQLKVGDVTTLKVTTDQVLPRQSVSYTFEGTTYQLEAKGDLPANDEHIAEIKNYELYLTINGSSTTLLFEQQQFNDTFMKITFVGDLDRDGKLDFIFSVPRDYEEQRTLLFLSSVGYHQAYEANRQFDC